MRKSIHRRNIKFKDAIDKADKKKIVGVAIDPSKEFHRVIIFDFKGKILISPFSIDSLKSGYRRLKININSCARRISAKKIYIAIEIAGSMSENLIRHLYKDYKNVVLIPPTAVAENRKQKSLVSLKNDDIDCGAVGDLLIRGEYIEYKPENIIYFKLKRLTYLREKLLDSSVTLKRQITGRFDRIYPGLNTTYGNHKAMYTHPNTDILYNGLLNRQLSAQKILKMNNSKLRQIWKYNKFGSGNKRIKQLKERLKIMLIPEQRYSSVELEHLKREVKMQHYIIKEIRDIESKIVEVGRKTPVKHLYGSISGIGDLYLAMYIGLVGDINRYATAGHIFSKAGLAPKISQSGSSKNRNLGISKAGNKFLRVILYRMATSIIVNEKSFKAYFQRIQKQHPKHWKKNRIAVANKLNRILFKLIKTKERYDSEKVMPLGTRIQDIDE